MSVLCGFLLLPGPRIRATLTTTSTATTSGTASATTSATTSADMADSVGTSR